jgi:DnaJ like chaperone protein
MALTLIGAVLGLLFGGSSGLLLGAFIGYVIGWILRAKLGSRVRLMQAQFFQSTFAIMGAICKADGVVTRDEIGVVNATFDRLHLSEEQRETAKADFNRGKATDFDLDAETDKLARIQFGRAPLFQLFLQIQCMAVAADGVVHPAEHEMLVRVARRLGLTERDVAQLEALLRASATGQSPAGAASAARINDAYTALGLSPDADVADIKRAYRRLMSQNHPDKLAAKGLPDSMREVAEERTREINVAYELIKGARQFS